MRLILYGGAVGDYDGAYDWIATEEEDDPNYALGYHPGDGLNNGYMVVEVVDYE